MGLRVKNGMPSEIVYAYSIGMKFGFDFKNVIASANFMFWEDSEIAVVMVNDYMYHAKISKC